MSIDDPQAEKATDANPYVNPTGDGYAGVYRLANDSTTVECHLSQTDPDWPVGTLLSVRAPAADRLVMAPPEGEADAITTTRVRTDRQSDRYVAVPSVALKRLAVDRGDDVRLYDRGDTRGLTVVARDADPFVGGGG